MQDNRNSLIVALVKYFIDNSSFLKLLLKKRSFRYKISRYLNQLCDIKFMLYCSLFVIDYNYEQLLIFMMLSLRKMMKSLMI